MPLTEKILLRFSNFTMVAVVLAIVCVALPVRAQYCMEYSPPPVFDTTNDGCSSEPLIDRSHFPGTIQWSGTEFLVHSIGNDLAIYDITNPTNPSRIERTRFLVGNVGDSDYDLQSWGMCDNCQYGFAWFKLAAVIIDFGTGSRPDLQSFEKEYDLPSLRSLLTFKHGSDQYLVADKVQDRCPGSGLYRINGASFGSLEFLECLTDGSGGDLELTGGTYLQDNSMDGGQAYIWASTGSFIHILKPVGSGSSLRLDYVEKLNDMRAIATGTHQLGFDVDLDNNVAASVFSTGLKIWEVQSLESPNPKGSFSNVAANILSMGHPVVWVAQGATAGSSNTFDISNMQNPVPLDNDFWDESNSWNDLPCFTAELGGAFSSDGDYLFLSRWEQMQRFDFFECGGEQPPSARVELDYWNGNFWTDMPSEVYPGDSIRISSASLGQVDSTQIWITDAGGATLDQTTGTAIEFDIPPGGTGNEPSTSYDAHVRVTNTAGSDQADSAVPFDDEPSADFDYTPIAPLEGDTLQLSASAEGYPDLPEDSPLTDPYQWTVREPGGRSNNFAGANPPAITLGTRGSWGIDLTVYYAHGGDPAYTATKSETLTISNVAAAFEVTPASPQNTQNITLNGADSRWSVGVTPDWSWQYRIGFGSWQTLSACDSQVCVIPGSETSQTLAPGTYDFRLTLSDPDDPVPENASVVRVDNIVVTDGTITVDFTWSPNSPEIGEFVGFEVTQLFSVDQVVWEFGGPNCDGDSQTVTCTPSFIDCMSWPYKYSTSGNKTVRMTATSDGQPLPTVTHVVNVQSSGSCGGGGGGGSSCTYNISSNQQIVPPEGGTGYSFSLTTTSGCSWTATKNVNWITFTSSTSGNGSSTIRYNVAANSGGSARAGTITVGGKTHTVAQEAVSCTYVLNPATRTIPRTGGSAYPLWVGTSDSNCGWTVQKSAAWIQLSASSGSGNQQLSYAISENTGDARTGTITMQGQTHTISQDGVPLVVDFTTNPESPLIGETITFSVSDDRLTPTRWEFGGDHCDGTDDVVDCTFTPDYCRNIEWQFAGPGWKTVKLVTSDGEKIRGVLVQNDGECCLKDDRPQADFSMTPNPVYTGDPVTFTDSSSKALPPKIQALDFRWDPVQPAIGEQVNLTIDGLTVPLATAQWDFGEAGCPPLEQVNVCEPVFFNCMSISYKFASAGDKTIQLSINNGAQTATRVLTVRDEGSCDGGGGGGGGGGGSCTYSISPNLRSFGEAGGSNTVAVSTQAGCAWTASESVAWITIDAGLSGTGSGIVRYTVAENTGIARSAAIFVAGRNHTVYQDAASGGGEPQDTEPTGWLWTISLGGTTVASSEEQDFTHVFEEVGQYQVSLRAYNCAGSDQTTQTLLVEESPIPPVIIPDAYIVPSAVHTPGLNDTQWRTDLRVFNPGDQQMILTIEYRPEDTDNTTAESHKIIIPIESLGTFAYDDILEAIPGILVDDDGSGTFSGSLSIAYTDDQGEELTDVPPLIVSRTYNQTATGTFGQFVPAEPDLPVAEASTIHLTGLVHNLYYRTNVRLANKGEEAAWAAIQLYDRNGFPVGERIDSLIEARSTTQINAIVEVAQHQTYLDIFSVQINSDSEQVSAWASVVDNTTGDPVLFSALKVGEAAERLWVPGVAHLAGINDSEWRSDFTFYNTDGDSVTTDIEYIPSEDEGFLAVMTVHGILPGTARYYVDILANEFLPGWIDESKGYFVITGIGGSTLPHVAGKTYNQDTATGGTFGQNMFVFEESDLLVAGTEGYIPGVAISSDPDLGFRTNIGLLNTDTDHQSVVTLTFLDEDGNVLGGPEEITLWAGRFFQPNLASRLGLNGVDAIGSVVIEVLSGGSVAAYASVVDNQTQDPILIPASPELILE